MRERRVSAINRLQELRESVVFVFWNLDQLKQDDFFSLADVLEAEDPSKPIDLIVLSPGGNGEAGYRIGHTFQQWAKKKGTEFRVIIPLYAMSAATILALGANRLVMGLQSEIGPIDPQIPKYDRARQQLRYIPALSILDGLKLISEHIDKTTNISKFFEEIFRRESITLDEIGELERWRESGKQMGQTLLSGGMINDNKAARKTVETLTDYYKNYGYPIDAYEAASSQLNLSVEHAAPNIWNVVKEIRDEYQRFVGVLNLVPRAIVASVVETARFRVWRYIADERGRVSPAVKFVEAQSWPLRPESETFR
jgi:hypothetical protein